MSWAAPASGRWIGVLLCSGILLLSACEEPRDVATISPEVVAMNADFIVFRGEQYITEAGVNQAHVTYDTAFQWVDSTDVVLRRVSLVVFEEDGTERAHVTSDRGILDSYSDRMIAQGNVILVVPGELRTLRTEELHYDPALGRIWSDSAFVMEEGLRRLSGCSFSSDLDFRNFQARGGCP